MSIRLTVEIIDEDTKQSLVNTRTYADNTTGEHIQSEVLDMCYSLAEMKNWDGEFRTKKVQ